LPWWPHREPNYCRRDYQRGFDIDSVLACGRQIRVVGDRELERWWECGGGAAQMQLAILRPESLRVLAEELPHRVERDGAGLRGLALPRLAFAHAPLPARGARAAAVLTSAVLAALRSARR